MIGTTIEIDGKPWLIGPAPSWSQQYVTLTRNSETRVAPLSVVRACLAIDARAGRSA